MLKHLDLFSGIGGFSLGLEATGGFETVAFCDVEEFPRKVLQKHWPDVKQYKDIKELTYDKLKADGIDTIDIITGGYPCQPFSVAGRKKGEEDPRHLWPEYFRLIKELRPSWVIGENVSGHIKLGLDTVIENLEAEGYAVRPFSISASSVGANHQRERVWIVAHSDSNGSSSNKNRRGFEKTIHESSKGEDRAFNIERSSDISKTSSNVANSRRSLWQGSELQRQNENETREGHANQSQRSSEASEFDVANTESISSYGRENGNNQQETGDKKVKGKAGRVSSNGANTNSERLQGQWSEHQLSESQGEEQIGWDGWWELEPDVGRVAHGVPKRVDRLKGLGNSLVPYIPYLIGKTILKT